MTKKRGLGRGLEALLSDISKKPAVNIDLPAESADGLKQVNLNKIDAGMSRP